MGMTIGEAIRQLHRAVYEQSEGGGRVLEIELNGSAWSTLERECERAQLTQAPNPHIARVGPLAQPAPQGRYLVNCDIPITTRFR